MLSAGIDVGAENLKVVILGDGGLAGFAVVSTGWDTARSLQSAFHEAAGKAGVPEQAVNRVGATGMGRDSVSFATAYLTDSICNGIGATWLAPSVRTVIDLGAERSEVLACDSSGKVLEYARNDNCAAGAGVFIEEMASALEVDVQEMGKLALASTSEITLNCTCTVFAESEVVSLMSQGVAKSDIARAICDSTAGKALSLLKGINMRSEVTCIGGVAMNAGVIAALEKRLRVKIIVPDEPRIVTAIGAALLARTAGGQHAETGRHPSSRPRDTGVL